MKIKYLITVIACWLALSVNAQDTVWISKKGTVIPSKDSAQAYDLIFRDNADTQKVKVKAFRIDGTILYEANYYPYRPKPVLDGVSKRYVDGQLADERVYTNGELSGQHSTYWDNGRIRRKDLYENGKFIRGNCYGFNGGDTTWFPYESFSKFPGGTDSLRRFIMKNFKYPPDAKHGRIQGTVKVKFMITQDGSVDFIEVINSVHPLLDREALRLVSLMPKWIPAMQEGRLVKSLFILPVSFRLEE
jgi:TonB family protein